MSPPWGGLPGAGGGRGGAHRGPQEAGAELRSRTTALPKPDQARRPRPGRAGSTRCLTPQGQRGRAAGSAVRGRRGGGVWREPPPRARCPPQARPGGLHKGRKARPAGPEVPTAQGSALPVTAACVSCSSRTQQLSMLPLPTISDQSHHSDAQDPRSAAVTQLRKQYADAGHDSSEVADEVLAQPSSFSSEGKTRAQCQSTHQPVVGEVTRRALY
ncbi:uncharacterized protein LOC141927323 [Strix aluco]|uniref:uncharacterized protein LOC141927323 n=1 Tax=Strix aluco TaxID=111821 RepID=UPI003DA487DA